jgi:hypothetical protein
MAFRCQGIVTKANNVIMPQASIKNEENVRRNIPTLFLVDLVMVISRVLF